LQFVLAFSGDTLAPKKRNCIGENLFANLSIKFEQNLHNSKSDAIAAFATLHRGLQSWCKSVLS
jgi:hypothetical protein